MEVNFPDPHTSLSEIRTAIEAAILESIHGLEGSSELTLDRRGRATAFAKRLSRDLYLKSGYVFVFRKGISTTDIQFRELLCLLRVHAQKLDQSGRIEGLQFTSTSQLQEELERAWDSYFRVRTAEDGSILLRYPPGAPKEHPGGREAFSHDAQDLISTFVLMYATYLSNLIVVDAYSSSALVYPFVGMDRLPLEKLCAESGYLHSCGTHIYFRNSNKATISELRESLKRSLQPEVEGLGELVYPLSVYSHETYSPASVDALRIHLRKQFLEGVPLVSAIGEVANSLGGRIFVLPGQRPHELETEDFRSKVKGLGSIPALDTRIWLFQERPTDPQDETRYLVCYAQTHKSESPFILFDEDKPAWVSPVTLPHSLASAMVNLVRPYFPGELEDGNVLTAVEPFCGSGTTVFELNRLLSPATIIYSNDRHVLSKVMLHDNLALFSAPALDLKKLQSWLFAGLIDVIDGLSKKALQDHISGVADLDWRNGYPLDERYLRDDIGTDPDPSEGLPAMLRNAIDLVRRIAGKFIPLTSEDGARQIDVREALKLRDYEFSENVDFMKSFAWHDGTDKVSTGCARYRSRLLFFLVWRTVVRNAEAHLRLRDGLNPLLTSAIPRELIEVLTKLSELEGIRKLEVSGDCPTYSGVSEKGGFCRKCSWSGEWFGQLAEKRRVLDCTTQGDAIAFLSSWKQSIDKGERHPVDIFIMDPPYGINTDEDHGGVQGLEVLYSKMFGALVACAANRCHILCCVPEVTKNGQWLPDYLTRDWIEKDLIMTANGLGFDVVRPIEVVPEPGRLFIAPFRWRSEKTLNRWVLHLILNKR